MIRRLSLAVLGGALALTLAACGSSASPAPAAPAPSSSGNQARGGPAASGTIASVASSSIEVQNANTGQVTVNFSADTTFTDRTSGTLTDVTQGSCVVVMGSGQPLVARTVEISAATANGCAGGGMRPRAGATSRAARPSGTNNDRNSGRAFGTVTAVTSTGFTVRQDNQQTGATTDVPVAADSSTTYTKSASADSSALKVGECATATGQTDETGAVTAKSIALSPAGPNGCSVGGGRRRDGGQNG